MEEKHLWGCRVYSGKHPSSSYSSSSFPSFPAMKGSDLCLGRDVDTWEYFPCPFCYVDVEVPVLCSHLQEEHCFDTRNAVCPLCAANVGKDMIGHFSIHHSHMLKRRKPQRTSLQSSCSPTTENETRGVNSYYGPLLTNSRRIASDPAPDPLLLSFIYNIPFPDNKDQVEETNSNVNSAALMPSHEKSSLPSTCDEFRAQDYEERSCRTEFVQQLIFSSIFWF